MTLRLADRIAGGGGLPPAFWEEAAFDVRIAGGDRKTLTRGECAIENCRIHHIGRLDWEGGRCAILAASAGSAFADGNGRLTRDRILRQSLAKVLVQIPYITKPRQALSSTIAPLSSNKILIQPRF